MSTWVAACDTCYEHVMHVEVSPMTPSCKDKIWVMCCISYLLCVCGCVCDAVSFLEQGTKFKK
jgi:ketopantoate reductase